MKKGILTFVAAMVLLSIGQSLAQTVREVGTKEEGVDIASEETVVDTEEKETMSDTEESESTDVKYDLGDVIVSATKTEAYQAEVGSSTSVITAEDIKKSGKKSVKEILRDILGVTVSQSGAFGGQTSVYLRGAKPGQTLVMIDGVEVNDPISADRSFNFANLITDNIERIEVVRGPQSTLYGSDAMAGVINIITKKGTGKPGFESYFEGGSHNTFIENIGSSGSIDKFNYSMSATRFDSDGISAAAVGSENDPYHNTAISSRVGYKILDNAELSLVAHYTDVKKSIDATDNNYPYGLIDMPNYTSWSKDLTTKLAFDQSINSWWTHTLSFSYYDIRRKDKKEWDPVNGDNVNDWYKGNNKKIEWQHNISPVKWNTLTAGLEYEDETGSSYYYVNPDPWLSSSKQDRKSVNNMGYYFQDQLKLWEKLFITPGVRIDDNELFGIQATYKISTAYLIPQIGTRFKGNWGTGFKAPSLFQLYSSYGNPNLRPDESRSYDVGFEQSLFGDKVSFGLTYFHNNFKNMVDFDLDPASPTYYKYINIGKAMTQGFEFGTKFMPLENLTFGFNFTYTDTEDKETGLELLRRPKRQFNFDIDWAFLPKANLQLGIDYVGSRKDVGYITDKAYTVVRIASSYDITKNLQVFGRIENLFDKKYQEVNGYATLDRSFYAGIKVSF